MDWGHSATLDVIRAARTLVMSAQKVADFRMGQVDPEGEEREALYEGEADYHVRIGEVGTLYYMDEKLRRANSALWELERRLDAEAAAADLPAEG